MIFRKKPILHINKDAILEIGDNVTINSSNTGYHLNMFGKCKLILDMPGSKIIIGDNTRIHGCCIHAFDEINIGSNCLIAANCQIIDNNGHDLSFHDVDNRINTVGKNRKIIIHDSVWLGTNVVILPGVTIGKGTVISANSVVNKDIPEMVIAGGNPIIIMKDFRITKSLEKVD